MSKTNYYLNRLTSFSILVEGNKVQLLVDDVTPKFLYVNLDETVNRSVRHC